jgi:hypothetical protein
MLCCLLRKTATVSESVSEQVYKTLLSTLHYDPINLQTSQHRGATVNRASFSPFPRHCKHFTHEAPCLIFVNYSNRLGRFNVVRIAVPEWLLCASSQQVVGLLRADILQFTAGCWAIAS